MKQAGKITILRNDMATIHSYQCPQDSEMVCSQVIETKNKLVIVDAQQFIPYAQELRRYADGLNKPIDRVIITHSHPDHWMGLELFTDIPIYALPETKDEIEKTGDYLVQYKRDQFGDLITSSKFVPTHIMREGTEKIDGLTYTFTKVVDSEISFSLYMELPELKTLVAQDLVYNHVYPCVGEMNKKGEYLFDGWVKVLKHLQTKGYEIVLSGHGEPADSTIFQEMIEYIEYSKQLFESGIGEQGLKQKLIERYPNYCITELLDISNTFLYHRTW